MGLAPNYIPPGWVEPNLGDGISRPKPSEQTRLYRVNVKQPGMPLMKVAIPAPSQRAALLNCKNRWPNCTAKAAK